MVAERNPIVLVEHRHIRSGHQRDESVGPPPLELLAEARSWEHAGGQGRWPDPERAGHARRIEPSSADVPLTPVVDGPVRDGAFPLMPLFLLETLGATAAAWALADRIGAERFPEVGVEHRFAAGATGVPDVWVVRAPSRDHAERWASAAALDVVDLRPIHAVQGTRHAGTTATDARTEIRGGEPCWEPS